ncbi:MAG: MMPL family transporter [Phycisphaerae bacterium]
MNLSQSLYRRRWITAAVWPVLAIALALLVPRIDPLSREQEAFLPREAPSRQAAEALARAFPDQAGLSEAVVVFERRDGRLTSEDLSFISRVADRIGQSDYSSVTDEELQRVSVRSPADIPLPAIPIPGIVPRNPLISPPGNAGQAALIRVNMPWSFITLRSSRIVDHLHAVVRRTGMPEGLRAAVTGSAAFGHDYALAAKRSNRRTMLLTVAVVVVILLVVYRAPLAAVIPLAAISLAAVAALSLLRASAYFGLHVGTAEEIFAFVLLYGAGTDYSLLLISRYRERLSDSRAPRMALPEALSAVRPALAASAGTDAAGLLMLSFATYGIFRSAGPAIALAIGVALLAVFTLIPALLGIFGRSVFWPGRAGASRRRFWLRASAAVTKRPVLVLIFVVPLLAVPAVRGAKLDWVYDTLTQVRVHTSSPSGGAAEGLEMARRHWPAGEMAPVSVLIRAEEPHTRDYWNRLAEDFTDNLRDLSGVTNVRSLAHPLGTRDRVSSRGVLSALGADAVTAEYISADNRAMRLEVALDKPAMTLEALAEFREVKKLLHRQTDGADIAGEVLLGGATAHTADIRSVTAGDFRRIAALVLTVIFVIVLALLRDVILAAMMVASTVLSYLATLGVSYWVFSGLLGGPGLDWKVQVFLFVVIAAVGVDYNIFLTARYAEESSVHGVRRAMARAVTSTGPVISSAGLIMAATLGSMMVGDLLLMQQLGFALATGMLIDTFVSRPLLLPAFIVLTRRRIRRGKLA